MVTPFTEMGKTVERACLGRRREDQVFHFHLDVRVEMSGRQLDLQSGIQGQDWV